MTTMTESSIGECPREFQIDFSRWRCGGKGKLGEAALGSYETYLLNPAAEKAGDTHNMCCLGLMLAQAGARPGFLRNKVSSEEVRRGCNALPDEADELPESFHDLLRVLIDTEVPSSRISNPDWTKLGDLAMKINDDRETQIEVKMRRLVELFAEVDITLEFINVPVHYLRWRPVRGCGSIAT